LFWAFYFFSGLGVGNFWGELGIRKNQNIFRKIITNNSENNYKLSYTPKPLSAPFPTRTPGNNPETSKQNQNHPPRKK
jgi:hypothetical protein